MEPITIKTRLNSSTIRLENVESLIGKEVEITVKEVALTQPKPKQWRHLGSVDLGGALDNVNIRDFAHDD